jgi:hypothetical protein
MKIKRISAGIYEFENDHGFKGSILKQPEGGWTVYNTETECTYDYGPTYGWAKIVAEDAGEKL